MRVTGRATLWRRWLASTTLTEREARIVVRCRLRDWLDPQELGATAWVEYVDQARVWGDTGTGGLADTAVVEGLVRRFNIETLKAKVRP